jgi:release factor glutamine methyltransferase
VTVLAAGRPSAPGLDGTSIGEALANGTRRLAAVGVESARLDADLLLADALGVSRAALLARRPEPLPEAAWARFEARLDRRAAREPLAYILGWKEFYGLSFEVSPAVLIPRPESELLVEEALAHLAREPQAHTRTPRVADVGTGSGCLAVAIAVHAPQARLVAVDQSAAALALARRNAARHAVLGQVRFVRGDLLSGVRGPLDVVVANLPYVAAEELAGLMPEVRRYEPRVALDGAADGLALLRPLVTQAAGRLAPGGLLLLEVAAGQAGRVADLLLATGAFAEVATRRDLAGVERLVRGWRWTRS